MRKSFGAWLPDDESDAAMIHGGLSYQSQKLALALPFLKNARVAVDVGAHCGLWTVQLGRYFDRVECFEPLKDHIECWKKNAGRKLSQRLHEVALGHKNGWTGINRVSGMSGRSYVGGDGSYPVRTLDSYQFKDVDLIKIDVEGFEYFVVKGAEETILENRPVMIVEQKKNLSNRYGLSDLAAVEYLESMGAKVRREIAGDYIMDFA